MTDKQTTGYARSAIAVSITLALGFCAPSAFAETGIFFQTLSDTAKSALPDHPSPTTVLSPGVVLAFGSKKYAVFGTDPCPSDPADTSGRSDFECLKITPGIVKSITLVPVGSNVPLRGRVVIKDTNRATIMGLTSLKYPNGREENITPPLIGRAGE